MTNTQPQTYKVKGTIVKGDGYGYTLNNRYDAEKLCTTLNTYHNTIQIYKGIETTYDKLTRELIQINMTLKILETEIQSLTELVKQ